MPSFLAFIRRLSALGFPFRSKPTVDASTPKQVIAAVFRRWAVARGLELRPSANDTGLRIFGRLGGRNVVVDPGIDSLHPGWVQITIGVALPAMKPVLVTRATRATDFATDRIRALFDDRDLGPDLRAISVAPRHMRLRLAPGASPRIVEHAVHAVGDVLRVIHSAPESDPRHSCTTTVPYPS